MYRQLTKLFSKKLPKHGFNSLYIHTSNVSQSKLLEVKDIDGVREIILNDPKTRNALSMAMMNDILSEIKCKLNDNKTRCIVISSTGPVYSAGHNLKELVPETGTEYHRKIFSKLVEIITTIYKAPIPIIAKVDGLAAAAGCQFVASCDMIICTERSSFSTPAANFGVFCSTPGIAISRTMPRMKSSYMLFTGLPITAQEAYVSGLVSKVVSNDKLNDEMNVICDNIKSKSRSVIKLGKEFFYQQLCLGIEDAYNMGEDVMIRNLQLDDGREGVKSFIEKRKPVWKN